MTSSAIIREGLNKSERIKTLEILNQINADKPDFDDIPENRTEDAESQNDPNAQDEIQSPQLQSRITKNSFG